MKGAPGGGRRIELATKVLAVIPARYGSTRFPGKPLAKIAGLPMILHVARRVSGIGGIEKVIVATDEQANVTTEDTTEMELIRKMLDMDVERLSAMGSAARARAVKLFSSEARTRRRLEVYERAIEHRKRGHC